uniref:Cholesterol 16beta,22S-hydroxylase n=1 Tax=Ornithogalum saundersiae TaxID=484171 RepID=A0AAU8JNS4_9ASPA
MPTQILIFSLLPTILFLVAALVLLVIRGKNERRKKRGLNIPPGTMGWPFIGETFSFMRTHSCTSLGHYLEDRKSRYGKIFRSHIFGKPTIVSLDAEFNRFVLLNDGKLFEPCFPKSVEAVLGKNAMLLLSGEIHSRMKTLCLTFMSIGRLRTRFLIDVESSVTQTLDSWKENSPFPAQEEVCKVAFNLMVKNIMSMNPGEPETEKVRRAYAKFMKGVLAIPLNLPWSSFRKALQSRSCILKAIEELMEKRVHEVEMGTDEIGEEDLMGYVLKNSTLNAEEFGDLLLGLLFGGHETSTTAMTLIIYFLHDCPTAVQQLREEHLRIIKAKRERGEPKALTWDDYKQMEFTQCVISEALRLGSVIRFVHRKATTDVQFKGYDIPSGWSIIPVFAAAHLDPSMYEDPEKFNPWRWQGDSLNTARIEYYMPFGQGARNCAGLELAKLEFAVFLHHLVLNFDWEVAEPDSPLTYAFPEFPKGLPIKVRRLSLV